MPLVSTNDAVREYRVLITHDNETQQTPLKNKKRWVLSGFRKFTGSDEP